MYCPKCGFRSDDAPGPAGCPKCRAASTPHSSSVAGARPRPVGRARVAQDRAWFSRGFKLTVAGIGTAVLALVLLPVLFPSPPTQPGGRTPSSQPNAGGRRPVGETGSAADVATAQPRAPQRASSTGDAKEIPDLPRLSATTATPALLSRAEELAREHPSEAWLREYVVNTHYWLARRGRDERRFREALDYLDESEEWGAAPGDVASYRALVHRDQNAWQQAEQWARAAVKAGSQVDPAEMHHVIGTAHYLREELDRAVEEFNEALALRDAPHIRASLDRARRDARTSVGFSRRRLSHFIVAYEGETMEDVGRMAIDTLERNYASLVSQLGFEPGEPVPVILYTRRSYREVSGGGRHMSAGLFDGKIRLPVRDVHWGDDYIRRTLHHELSHAFFHARTGGHDPRWLNEGLAEYVEGERTIGLGKRLVPHLGNGGTLEGCLLASRYNCDVFYPAAASVVDYTIQLRGMGGIRDVLSNLAEGRTIDETLRTVLGKDERGLIRDWEHFVRRRH